MYENAFIEYLEHLPAWGVYVFMCISAVIENVFPPWPGDTVTVFGGFLAGRKVISVYVCFISILTGNLIGANIMYFLGNGILIEARKYHDRFTGPAMIKKVLFELTSQEQLDKTHVWFEKWGILFVLVSRFSAGVRFFVSIIAGISKMNYWIFLFCFSISVFFWNSLLLAAGLALGEEWRKILDWLKIYNIAIISILAAAVVTYIIWRWRKKKNRPQA